MRANDRTGSERAGDGVTSEQAALRYAEASYATDVAYHIHMRRFDKDKSCGTPEYGSFVAAQGYQKDAFREWVKISGRIPVAEKVYGAPSRKDAVT
jgi:hypothetical protein